MANIGKIFGVSFSDIAKINTSSIKHIFGIEGDSWVTPTDIPAAEAQALRDFYTATDGPNWTTNTNWGTSATANDWYGVTVVGGHVTVLALSNNALSGDVGSTVPTTVETLDLGQNTGITDIDVSGLTSADNIDLAGCDFGQSVVSGILEDVVTAGVSAGTLDIGGSNSAAQPAGVAALMQLESNSWTLTYSTVVRENTGDFFIVTTAGSGAFRSSATDLSGQTGKYIVVKDSAGKYAEAYIDAADIAEAFGASIVTNGTMEADANWVDYGLDGGETNERSAAQAQSGTYSRHLVVDAINEGCYQSGITIVDGMLYRLSCYFYGVSGEYQIRSYDGVQVDTVVTGSNTGSWEQISAYWTAKGGTANGHMQLISNAGAAEFYADVAVFEPVTNLGADAVTVESTASGADGVWTSVEAGFLDNDIAQVEVFNE